MKLFCLTCLNHFTSNNGLQQCHRKFESGCHRQLLIQSYQCGFINIKGEKRIQRELLPKKPLCSTMSMKSVPFRDTMILQWQLIIHDEEVSRGVGRRAWETKGHILPKRTFYTVSFTK